jgi:hypothetical protein
MTNTNHPKISSFSRTAAAFVGQLVRRKTLSTPHPTSEPTSDQSDFVERIRYAPTAAGKLSNGDPDVLRRYVLDAHDEAEQSRRQDELFRIASIQLSCLPKSGPLRPLDLTRPQYRSDLGVNSGYWDDSSEVRSTNTGLFCCPIVLTSSQRMEVYRRLAFDHPRQVHFRQAVERALAMYSATPLAAVRAESAIAIDDLNGITPLQVHTALTREIRKMSGVFQPSKPDIAPDMRNPRTDPRRNHEAGWSLNLPQRLETTVPVGPDCPAAFLIIGYFSYDLGSDVPQFNDPSGDGQRQLKQLIEAYLAQDTCSPFGEAGMLAESLRAQAVVGRPQWIHEALTVAQRIELQVMATNAGRSNKLFDLKLERRGTVLDWRATVSSRETAGMNHPVMGRPHVFAVPPSPPQDDEDSEPVVVEHVYESFWRPQVHIAKIRAGLKDRVAMDALSAGSNFRTSRHPVQLSLHFDDGQTVDAHSARAPTASGNDWPSESLGEDESGDKTIH